MSMVEIASMIADVIHGMHGIDKPFSESSRVARLFPMERRYTFAERLEEKFGISLEREEINAWTDLGDVKNSVVNQYLPRRETDAEKIKKNMPMYGTNVGHGHVWARPDGSKARCGGPSICQACARDKAWTDAALNGEDYNTVGAEPTRPPINRIEHKDVKDFRYRNYVGNALDKYQDIAIKSAIYPGKGTPFGLMYVALGLAEAGEVQNKVKKGFRDDNWIEFYGAVSERGREVVFNPITPERRAQIEKELRGLLWYVAAVSKELGLSLHDIALGNLEELCGRTDRGTLSGDGDDR